jgi:hypothetical protein
MKTRLTSKYSEYINCIEAELTTPFSIDSNVIFSILPSMGSGHFSIQLIEAGRPFLLVRHWNQDPGQNIPLGIFNLDNIKIDEDQVEISADDISILRNIKTIDIEIKDLDGIILDGIDFKLIVNGQQFQWRASEQITMELQQLLSKMIDLAGLQQRLWNVRTVPFA